MTSAKAARIANESDGVTKKCFPTVVVVVGVVVVVIGDVVAVVGRKG